MASRRAAESGSTIRAAEPTEENREAAAARRERTAKALRQMILHRVEGMVAASERSAFPDPLAIEEVDRLQRVLRAYERARPAPPSHRRFLVGGFGLTAVLIAALLFMRVGSTEITLDLRVEHLSLDSARKQILTGTMGAAAIALGGIERVSLPPGVESDLLDNGGQGGEILAVALTAPPGGVLGVDPVAVNRGTRVEIGRAQFDGTTSIALLHPAPAGGEPDPMTLQVTVPDGVSLDLANSFGGPERFDLDGPRAFAFVFAADTDGYVDLTPMSGDPPSFGSEIEVDRLSFARVQEVEGEAARRLSTIVGGTVFLESLGGKALPLRQGEYLDIDLENATITSLSVTSESIELRASGRAHALSVASPLSGPTSDSGRSLMPRWLEWLTARHEIELFWAATLYVFGLLLGILRFWGIGR